MNYILKKINLLLSAVVFALAFAACGGETAQTDNNATAVAVKQASKPADEARRSILFFGNSLTAAYNLSPEQGFTAIIQGKIDSLGLPYRCINAGLSGETTQDGLNRVDWVLQNKADIFVLELGGNDALRGLPVEQSVKNMQGILDKVKAKYPDCKILVTGMLAPPNLGRRYTNAFRDMYPNLAKQNGATLLPFLLEGVAGIDSLNLEDGIHPNISGQKIVAENVWRALKPML